MALRGQRQKALLALLLVRANQLVTNDGLIEDLWSGQAPPTASAALRVHVARLRKALGSSGQERLVTHASGYELTVAPGELDLHVFEQLVEEADRATAEAQWPQAADQLHEALRLWRGAPLANLTYEPSLQAEIARLDELRFTAVEKRIQADLELGRHANVIGELEAMIAAHPMRERPREQLMLAYYRSGRQTDALALYQGTWRLLVDELGIDPSPALRQLESQILRHDPLLGLPLSSSMASASSEKTVDESNNSLVSISGQGRKVVTVLVTAPKGPRRARSQDPELRRRAGDRFLAMTSPVLERHGASIVKLVDDRVMGLFGVPAAHEDDAFRAVRAAVELREALAGGGGGACTGIETGEVLTGEPAVGERLVTGDAVDGAAFLHQTSHPGEILIGEATRRLIRDAVKVEPLSLPVQDGDTDPSDAWRLLELIPGAPPLVRRLDAPLIGREDDLAQLHQAFTRALREQRACLVTVFGDAGIGKTRLAQEFARSLQGQATVLTGRCLSYGEGITYWPIREIVEQAAAGRGLGELLQASPDGEVVAERLESTIGSRTSGVVTEEVFWAVRKLIEALAHESPLLLIFEDVHWGEATLLDLIEHVTDWVRHVPVLVICLARPELLDERPAWGGGQLNATSILLSPLSDAESAELMDVLPSGADLSSEAQTRIADAAEGNPLFVEQMLAMLAEEGSSTAELTVPPAIQALLSARLDRLEPDDRRALERASVEGETFHAGGVIELSPLETRESVHGRLLKLVRKELVRPEPPGLRGEEAFRFRHALIRDAAYEAVPKEARSDLHERFAVWFEKTAAERAEEYEEFIGYHLEQAFWYSAELEPAEPRTAELAERARGRLASAGRFAFRRGDTRAAINLLERARALPSTDDRPWLALTPHLGFALLQVGELERADSVLSEAIERAGILGDHRTERHAWLVREQLRLTTQPERINATESLHEAQEALAVLQEAGDDDALTRAWICLYFLYHCTGDAAALREATERALDHARKAGSRLDEAWSLTMLGYSLTDGPTPACEGARVLENLLDELRGDPFGDAMVCALLAYLVAMQGRIDEARALIVRSQGAMAELGLGTSRTLAEMQSGRVEILAGNPEAAERAARAAAQHAAEIADSWFYVDASIDVARAVCDQGRPRECLRILDETEKHASPPDPEIDVSRPATRALALAQIGHLSEAEALATVAVTHAREMEYPNYHGDALVVLAEILQLTNRPAEAATALSEAAFVFNRKGNLVSAGHALATLKRLR
jgi:DNA-binding SARP family transcriptional activator/class 3 adenylate cyclase